MNSTDIAYIESNLAITLPEAYKEILLNYPFEEGIGDFDYSIGDCSKSLVKWTKEYRNGFAGNAKWPSEIICIGTESDGCPMAMDLNTLKVMKIYKGSYKHEFMEEYDSIDDFLEQCKKDYADD